VRAQDVKEIVEQHLIGGKIVDNLLHPVDEQKVSKKSELPFFKNQDKQVLRNCGKINPTKIADYIACGGYKALSKVLTSMSSEQVVQEVTVSGLRGRGGAGFPTGTKWNFARKSQDTEKYILCNADEGDPGAFMDRSILEGDPHSIIEGMAIGAFAIGSSTGYVYVRAEYPLAIERLQIAIDQALEFGLIGKDILGTGFNFDLEIRKGSGAFVCGEETALITSIEGNRGEPRPRPPFPAEKGLWNKPTVLNNVETFSNIPLLINKGGAQFAEIGTEKSKGTKIFALAGTVKISGLVEVPVGTPLRKLVYDIGGGISTNKKYKAAQIGGPSGGCIPEEHLDVPLDYESLNILGAIMGSGGLIVMDESSCMVDVARFFLEFVQDESCGKCVPCREGTARMKQIVDRICEGKGEMKDIDELEKLASTVTNASLCGLGQTAPNPVLSTLRHFREEYIEHIRDKKCRTAVCKELIVFEILDLCNGCQACKKVCPVEAIHGEKKQAHIINTELCIRCGLCLSTCKFDAIVKY
jgi:NADH:ubiquinone oxidoreductase subunit F (NADH-binding)/NAD-dependent dihydropyrimidine dehydrogenase PreA subunit